MKILGLMPLVASGAYFVPEPWQWLFAVYPPYCASKLYWIAEAGEGPWFWWLPAAGVGVAVWITFLGRAFLRAARR